MINLKITPIVDWRSTGRDKSTAFSMQPIRLPSEYERLGRAVWDAMRDEVAVVVRRADG